MTYSLIIPIYNEIRTLPLLLNKLKDLNPNIETIIIDDGSDDGSEILLSKIKNFKILRNESNLGKGESIKRGVFHARNDIAILMDGDLEVDIGNIPTLIKNYEKGKTDVLVGIRWEKSSLTFEINTLGNYLINYIFNILYQSNLHDVLCCVKILEINLFKSLNILSSGFSIEVETMAKLVLRDLKIEEVKIRYKRRTANEGKKLKLSDSWDIIYKMFTLRFL